MWPFRTTKLNRILAGQAVISAKLDTIQRKLDIMAHTLDDVLAAVQAGGTKEDSIIALFAGLKKQVADLTSGALSPDVQAKVDAIFDAASANSSKIDAALAPAA